MKLLQLLKTSCDCKLVQM